MIYALVALLHWREVRAGWRRSRVLQLRAEHRSAIHRAMWVMDRSLFSFERPPWR